MHHALSDYERGSIEMLIDSEGCLRLSLERQLNRSGTMSNRLRAILLVVNTDQGLIRKAFSIMGGNIIYRPRKGGNKPQWTLTLLSNQLRWLLPQLCLTAKAEQQRLLLEALPLLQENGHHLLRGEKGRIIAPNRDRLFKIATELKQANRKGVSN